MCEALWNAMLENGRQILIAAPSLAEMIRQEGKDYSIPRRRGVEVVAFDDRAAVELGRRFPERVLRDPPSGYPPRRPGWCPNRLRSGSRYPDRRTDPLREAATASSADRLRLLRTCPIPTASSRNSGATAPSCACLLY